MERRGFIGGLGVAVLLTGYGFERDRSDASSERIAAIHATRLRRSPCGEATVDRTDSRIAGNDVLQTLFDKIQQGETQTVEMTGGTYERANVSADEYTQEELRAAERRLEQLARCDTRKGEWCIELSEAVVAVGVSKPE